MRSPGFLPPSFWPSVCKLLTGEAWPSIGESGASRLIEQCSWHGLLPLLFDASEVPPAVERARDAARGWERILQVRSHLLREAIAAVCDLLVDQPVMLLKGADYGQRLYPSPFLRPMNDIDLLVPAGHIDAICDRLVAAGLVRQPAFGAGRDAAYHERVFFFRGALLEVHQAFIQRPRHRIDYEAIWQRAVPIAVEGRRVLRLDDVDALAYHALSMAIDQFHTRMVRYLDLWLLIRCRTDIAAAAARRAREWRSARALYGALSVGCRIFPELVTADVDAAMAAAVSSPTRQLLERWVLPATPEMRRHAYPRRGVQLWRKAWLMDSAGHALSFALSHAAATLRHRR